MPLLEVQMQPTSTTFWRLETFLVMKEWVALRLQRRICLAGFKSLALFDPEVVYIEDLGSQFLLREEDVGVKSRAEASASRLPARLLPAVEVKVLPELPLEDVKDFQVIVLCNAVLSQQLELNTWTRDNGSLFVDLCDTYTYTNSTGEETKTGRILSIDELGVVHCPDEMPHDLSDRDFVTFAELDGPLAPELNACEPRSGRLRLGTGCYMQGIWESMGSAELTDLLPAAPSLNHVENLTIGINFLESEKLLRALELFPALQKLFILYEPKESIDEHQGALGIVLGPGAPQGDSAFLDKLERLMHRAAQTDNGDNPSPRLSPALFPSLQSISLLEFAALTDDTLAQFVRTCATRGLRKVECSFSRRRQRDIRPELHDVKKHAFE
ncbi:hypothetical protein C8F01DRAFT_1258939 [Mycena amicta]|nr:hypothetical protein C8F01DRAFT_1258939 [Mycena amicta]